jgi:hypothetical protein
VSFDFNSIAIELKSKSIPNLILIKKLSYIKLTNFNVSFMLQTQKVS